MRGVDRAAERLLGRHVGDGADDHPGDASGATCRAPCARPKSPILAVPSLVSQTLPGLRSRWMMPCSCAYSSAWQILLGDAQRLGERQAMLGRLRDQPLDVAAGHQLA